MTTARGAGSPRCAAARGSAAAKFDPAESPATTIPDERPPTRSAEVLSHA